MSRRRITTYVIKPPIRPHEPSCSGVKLLVTIRIKIKPVTTVESPITNPINPEYVTRTSDNVFSPSFPDGR